jgi:hypothetical protein
MQHFLLLTHLVTVYFRNDLVTNCFFRDKIKNRFSTITSGSFYLSIFTNFLNAFYNLVLQTRENARIEFLGSRFN